MLCSSVLVSYSQERKFLFCSIACLYLFLLLLVVKAAGWEAPSILLSLLSLSVEPLRPFSYFFFYCKLTKTKRKQDSFSFSYFFFPGSKLRLNSSIILLNPLFRDCELFKHSFTRLPVRRMNEFSWTPYPIYSFTVNKGGKRSRSFFPLLFSSSCCLAGPLSSSLSWPYFIYSFELVDVDSSPYLFVHLRGNCWMRKKTQLLNLSLISLFDSPGLNCKRELLLIN